MAGIHQFVPMLHRFDAVGNHVRAIYDALMERGVPSDIYVEHLDEDTCDLTQIYRVYEERAERDDVLVYHLATASAMAAWLHARSETLAVVYHNVTPPRYFTRWDDRIARLQVAADAEMRLFARRAAIGIADSEFNRNDLVDADFALTKVLPPILELPAYTGRERSKQRRSSGVGWLTVGRLAPNKAVERVIAALYAYRHLFDPAATLVVVGRTVIPAYGEALKEFAADLGLAGAVRFVERVDDVGLAHLYEEADVVVLASEHEGFCVPLVEAMAAGLLVVAFRSGAVPEVLGDAGVLVDDRSPRALAGAVFDALGDPTRPDPVVVKQTLEGLGLSGGAARYVEALRAVSVCPPGAR